MTRKVKKLLDSWDAAKCAAMIDGQICGAPVEPDCLFCDTHWMEVIFEARPSLVSLILEQ
jgi:hypothetical protein